MACRCDSLPAELNELNLAGWSGLGTAVAAQSPCTFPENWEVRIGSDGKCYNTCPAEDMAFELYGAECAGLGVGFGGGGGLLGGPGGLSQTQVLVFALGAVLLVSVMSRS